MYDRQKLFETLGRAEYRTIDENGKILSPSHDVFKNISNHMHSLGSPITPKHVYTIINTNRNGMKDYVMRMFNINKSAEMNKSVDDNTFDLSNASNVSNIQNVTFSLVLSNDVWKTVKPTKKTYCNRKYVLLQPGKWTHIFASKIWEQKKNSVCIYF